MTEFLAGQFDIAVIGAGHAGIEAALAAARLGMETIVFTINLDAVGNMPCNPAIGGTGKGHLVRELDALGGEMAKAADACCIQYRLLNKGKGPAVWSLRAQADRRRYQEYMKHTLEQQDHLTVRQGEVVEVRTENGAVSAVVLATGAVFSVKAVILATGTYLAGRTIVGEVIRDSGPDGLAPSGPLAERLRELGLSLRRFKTGTISVTSLPFDHIVGIQPLGKRHDAHVDLLVAQDLQPADGAFLSGEVAVITDIDSFRIPLDQPRLFLSERRAHAGDDVFEPRLKEGNGVHIPFDDDDIFQQACFFLFFNLVDVI